MLPVVLSGVSGWLLVVLSGVSGWLLVVLLPVAIALPFVRQRPGLGPPRPLVQRLTPHYWVGYAIAALAIIHAWIATATGLALRTTLAGVYLALGAMFLVVTQVFLGLLLREPSLRRRAVVRRRHLWVMMGIVALALGHIALNSTLLHSLVGRWR